MLPLGSSLYFPSPELRGLLRLGVVPVARCTRTESALTMRTSSCCCCCSSCMRPLIAWAFTDIVAVCRLVCTRTCERGLSPACNTQPQVRSSINLSTKFSSSPQSPRTLCERRGSEGGRRRGHHPLARVCVCVRSVLNTCDSIRGSLATRFILISGRSVRHTWT